MIHLAVDRRYQNSHIEEKVKQAAAVTLARQGIDPQRELCLVITGDRKLKELNTQFRGEAHATDVLSFPAGESNSGLTPGYLGDVAISMPRARAQAKIEGHSLVEELQLLTVHGVLHLLGYDHGDPQEKSRMWAAQDAILKQLGASIKSPHSNSPGSGA
jgi:probable rRNA maturation factor